MAITLLEAKNKLKVNCYRHAGEEQDEFEKILSQAQGCRYEFLCWVVSEYQGFIDTRKQAGIIFVQEYEDEAQEMLRKLIVSDNPDNRDTASEILQETKPPNASELVRSLLEDPYPYLQFDACEFLKDEFPSEVKTTLLQLAQNKDARVRAAAQQQLLDFEK